MEAELLDLGSSLFFGCFFQLFITSFCSHSYLRSCWLLILHNLLFVIHNSWFSKPKYSLFIFHVIPLLIIHYSDFTPNHTVHYQFPVRVKTLNSFLYTLALCLKLFKVSPSVSLKDSKHCSSGVVVYSQWEGLFHSVNMMAPIHRFSAGVQLVPAGVWMTKVLK